MDEKERVKYYVDIISSVAERTIRRLWILCILLALLLVGSWIGFYVYENQFVDESWTFEASTDDGGNAIANGNGEVYFYGDGESNTN